MTLIPTQLRTIFAYVQRRVLNSLNYCSLVLTTVIYYGWSTPLYHPCYNYAEVMTQVNQGVSSTWPDVHKL